MTAGSIGCFDLASELFCQYFWLCLTTAHISVPDHSAWDRRGSSWVFILAVTIVLNVVLVSFVLFNKLYNTLLA